MLAPQLASPRSLHTAVLLDASALVVLQPLLLPVNVLPDTSVPQDHQSNSHAVRAPINQPQAKQVVRHAVLVTIAHIALQGSLERSPAQWDTTVLHLEALSHH